MDGVKVEAAKQKAKSKFKSAGKYLLTFLKWFVLAAVTGAVGGVVGALFHLSVEYVTGVRKAHSWIVFLLPVGGLVIVGLYKLSGKKDIGTNEILDAVRSPQGVPALLAPLIFVSTVITHLFGGSAVKFSLPDLFGGIFGSGGFGGAVSLVLSVLVALILAGCVAALFAWLIGLPVLRLKSDYLAIATLGFAEILRAIFQWQKLGPVTNGANMIKSFPTFTDFNISGKNGSVVLYLSTFVPFLIAIICIAIIVLLINSTYGRAFKAIRDDEVAAEAMGINLAKHKMLSFVTSSFFAGVGGALFAMYVANAQAKVFTATMTYEILLIVVIGGIGSISGSCIATFLYVACSEWWLRFLDSETFIGNFKLPLLRSGFRMVVFSVVIMIVVLFFRKGIMGDRELPDLIRARRAKRAAKAAKKEEASK